MNNESMIAASSSSSPSSPTDFAGSFNSFRNRNNSGRNTLSNSTAGNKLSDSDITDEELTDDELEITDEYKVDEHGRLLKKVEKTQAQLEHEFFKKVDELDEKPGAKNVKELLKEINDALKQSESTPEPQDVNFNTADGVNKFVDYLIEQNTHATRIISGYKMLAYLLTYLERVNNKLPEDRKLM